MKKILALDAEDEIINFFDGREHTTFSGRNMCLDAWIFLKKLPKNSEVWACNLEYDLVNVFGDWLGRICTLQYTSGGLIKATFRDRPGLVFRDTLRHWPVGVKAMGEIIGLPKIDVAGKFIDIEYCRRDTEIVWRFVMAMIKKYDRLGLTVKSPVAHEEN